MENILYIVVPCYHEEEVLPETGKRLTEKLAALIAQGNADEQSRILFVDDGSKDGTWDAICKLADNDSHVSGIRLSRNRGHQNALLAGLMTARNFADMVISMDADLQDDIDACDEMIRKYQEGYDVVYGVRSARKTDTFFKRHTAQAFYRVMNWMGANTVYNHADYRLLSRRFLDSFAEYSEVNLFLRGMIPLVGYRSAVVYYERGDRFAGESKYPLSKMIAFAIEGITSLSTKPIQRLGIFLISVGMLLYSLIRHFSGHTVVGWTSIVISVWAIGGLILLSLGVIGEYIGKIYLESKRRPRYIIERSLNLENESAERV